MSYTNVCVSLYDYTAQNDEELSFQADSILYIINESEPGWFYAVDKLSQQHGIVPANYIQEIQPISMAKSLYTYETTKADELCIPDNAEVVVLEKNEDDWWLVKFDNRVGLVPSNYLQEEQANDFVDEGVVRAPEPEKFVEDNAENQSEDAVAKSPKSVPNAPFVDPLYAYAQEMSKEFQSGKNESGPYSGIELYAIQEIDKKKKKPLQAGFLGTDLHSVFFIESDKRTVIKDWSLGSITMIKDKKDKRIQIEFGKSVFLFDAADKLEQKNLLRALSEAATGHYKADHQGRPPAVSISSSTAPSISISAPVAGSFVHSSSHSIEKLSGDEKSLKSLSSQVVGSVLNEHSITDEYQKEMDCEAEIMRQQEEEEEQRREQEAEYVRQRQEEELRQREEEEAYQRQREEEEEEERQRMYEEEERQKHLEEERQRLEDEVRGRERSILMEAERQRQLQEQRERRLRKEREEKERSRKEAQLEHEQRLLKEQQEKEAKEKELRESSERKLRERELAKERFRKELEEREKSNAATKVSPVTASPPSLSLVTERKSSIGKNVVPLPPRVNPQKSAVLSTPEPPTRPARPAPVSSSTANISTSGTSSVGLSGVKVMVIPDRSGKPKASRAEDLPNADRLRTWTDKSGNFQVEAEMLKLAGDKVLLHKSNGVKLSVPLDRLSEADSEWAISHSNAVNDTVKKSESKLQLAPPRPTRNQKSASDNSSNPIMDEANFIYKGFNWFLFFTAKCGINAEDAKQYASTFVSQKMDETMLHDVDKELLRRLKVAEGDIIRVRKAASNAKEGAGASSEVDDAFNLRAATMGYPVKKAAAATSSSTREQEALARNLAILDSRLAQKLQQVEDAKVKQQSFGLPQNQRLNQGKAEISSDSVAELANQMMASSLQNKGAKSLERNAPTAGVPMPVSQASAAPVSVILPAPLIPTPGNFSVPSKFVPTGISSTTSLANPVSQQRQQPRESYLQGAKQGVPSFGNFNAANSSSSSAFSALSTPPMYHGANTSVNFDSAVNKPTNYQTNGYGVVQTSPVLQSQSSRGTLLNSAPSYGGIGYSATTRGAEVSGTSSNAVLRNSGAAGTLFNPSSTGMSAALSGNSGAYSTASVNGQSMSGLTPPASLSLGLSNMVGASSTISPAMDASTFTSVSGNPSTQTNAGFNMSAQQYVAGSQYSGGVNTNTNRSAAEYGSYSSGSNLQNPNSFSYNSAASANGLRTSTGDLLPSRLNPTYLSSGSSGTGYGNTAYGGVGQLDKRSNLEAPMVGLSSSYANSTSAAAAAGLSAFLPTNTTGGFDGTKGGVNYSSGAQVKPFENVYSSTATGTSFSSYGSTAGSNYPIHNSQISSATTFQSTTVGTGGFYPTGVMDAGLSGNLNGNYPAKNFGPPSGSSTSFAHSQNSSTATQQIFVPQSINPAISQLHQPMNPLQSNQQPNNFYPTYNSQMNQQAQANQQRNIHNGQFGYNR